jgi:hypothetical protein
MRCLLLAAVMFAGCSKSDDGPSCEKVVDNMMTVTKAAMTGHGNMELSNKKAMIDQCIARKMPASQRTCLAAAKDLAMIAACSPPPKQ